MDSSFIGKRVAELCKQKKVSEYQVSYDLGRNKNYVGEITAGRMLPSLSALFEIVDYFELTPAEFFIEDGPQNITQAIRYMKHLNNHEMQIVLTLLQSFVENK